MAKFSVTRLTCEHRVQPLGIDCARPRFSWWMDDSRPGAAQSAFRLQVAEADDFSSGPVVWDTGERVSADSVLVPYDGTPLRSLTRYFVRVRLRDHLNEWCDWSDRSWFETAFLETSEWQAEWIGPSDDDGETGGPPPYLRKEFAGSSDVVAARLYVAARGLAEVSINGSRVGDDVLSPGWTDYNARVQYLTYDVTELIESERNVVGAILGDGWYSGRIARVRDGQRCFGARPQLLCEIHVRLRSGEVLVVKSDGSWQWRTGPLLVSDLYDGESYDARLEPPGWDTAEVEESGWSPVRVIGPAAASWDGAGGRKSAIDAKVVPPIRRITELTPVGRTEPESGRFIFDLGQNITGWARVRLSGEQGATITLRFAEMLNPDGTPYVENLRSAKATDTYVCADDREFVWEPRFTFHGFRYIEVSGVASAPEADRITGVVVYNDLEETGTFTCSHPLVNQLQSNIRWGQRGNYLDVPTDCPQRDERLGWTGDAQVFIPTAAFNMQVAPFFVKWQRDMADAQGPRGTIPSIAPAVRYMTAADENDGGPAWSDAFVICPWVVYEKYGDLRVVEDHYDAMYRFVESMRARSRGLIRSDQFIEDWGGYGDWVSMDAPEGSTIGATPKDLIGTAYFAYSVELLRRMAELLGKDRDVVTLRDLHRRVVRAFRDEYVTPAGRVLGDTQTAYVVALAFDMLPEELRQSAVDRLVRLLELRGWRLSTGFVGTPLLCPVLSRFGRDDVAYRLLLQEEYPSWLYTVNQGATTMWERWNSYTHERGFGPVSMNSFNHYAYGSIGDWMYRTVAGLSVEMSRPGEPPIRIAPRPGFGVTEASAELVTPFGPAKTAWTVEGAVVNLDIVVPPNASARVTISAGQSDIRIDAGDGEAQLEDLVVPEGTAGDDVTFRVTAGRYRFGWTRTPSE